MRQEQQLLAGDAKGYKSEQEKSHQSITSWIMPETRKDEAAPSLRRPMLGLAFPLEVFTSLFSVIVSYTWSISMTR